MIKDLILLQLLTNFLPCTPLFILLSFSKNHQPAFPTTRPMFSTIEDPQIESILCQWSHSFLENVAHRRTRMNYRSRSCCSSLRRASCSSFPIRMRSYITCHISLVQHPTAPSGEKTWPDSHRLPFVDPSIRCSNWNHMYRKYERLK